MANSTYGGRVVLEVLWEGEESRTRVIEAGGVEPTLISYDSHFLNRPAIAETSEGILALLQQATRRGAIEDGLSFLQKLGGELFRLLLPEDTRNRLQLTRAKTLLLKIEESCVHLPWELIYDSQDFLCCRFALGRAIVTKQKQSPAIRSSTGQPLSFLVVSNPTGDLDKTSEEGDYLYHLFANHPKIRFEWFNGEIDCQTLRALLPEYQVFHFSGHGEYSRDDPTQCSLILREGRLNSSVLDDFAARRIPVPRLVFNNSCSGAETTQVEAEPSNGGHCLAKAFLGAGCNHYVGAVADVLDDEGKEFSARFYERALEGHSVGDALRSARLETRSRQTSDSLLWAQYVLYGNPDETLFGDHEKSQRSNLDEKLKEGSTLLTLLFCELVGTEEHLEDMGYGRGRSLIESQMRIIDEALSEFQSAGKIEEKMDRLILAFLRPSEAVHFSLEIQHRLKTRQKTDGNALPIRIGIHMGEVMVAESARAEGRMGFEGVVADTTLRILRIAQAGQIILSRTVFDSARAVLRSSDLRNYESVSWLDHGAYRIKGLEEPIGICEIGESGLAPLTAPIDSDIAYRYLSPDQEPVLGWRPAIGQKIPTSPGWTLEEKLGSGGFGEVWKATNQELEETHVFKFCFRADSLRSLKRETTLFRLLKERIGVHRNILRFFSVYFKEAPYYLEMEYVPGKDLLKWCNDKGGLEQIPFLTRIEIVSQVAEGLQAAHDCGVIHRDVKPSNILVMGDAEDPEKVEVKLTDFGIGQVVSKQAVSDLSLTGFTETISATERETHSGSRLYMAPELLVGGHATVRSDIYALGVVLYQLVMGDLGKPLPTDWRGQIQNPLIAEDLARCLTGEPERRFNGAGEIARNLRSLPQRRADLIDSERAERQRRRRQFRARVLGFGAGVFLVISFALGYGLLREHAARLEARKAQDSAERELYVSSIYLADRSIGELQYARAVEHLLHCPQNLRRWEWGYLLYRCNQEIMKLEGHMGEVGAVVFGPDGTWVASGSADGTARIWDLQTGEERSRLLRHKAGIWAIAASPDGGFIATGSEDKSAILWDTKNGEIAHTLLGHEDEICAIAFDPSGRTLATGGPDSMAKIWDTQTGDLLREIPVPKPEKIWSLCFSPDGRYLAAGCEDDHRRGEEQCARVFEVETGIQIRAIGHPGIVDAVEFSPDGRLLATGDQYKVTRLWDWKNGEAIGSFEGHAQSVWDLTFSPDGTTLATAGLEGTIVLWDLASGTKIRTLEGHTGNVFSVSFNGNGEKLASSGADGSVRIWDGRRGQAVDLLQTGSSGTVSPCFSPDSQILSTAGTYSQDGPSVLLWNTWTSSLERSLFSHPQGSNTAIFSPDGAVLGVGGSDDAVSFWDLAGDREVRLFSPSATPASTGGIVALLYGPNGNNFLTATRRGEISIWRNETLERLATAAPPEDNSQLQAIAWSPDGSLVAASAATPEFSHPGLLELRNAKTLRLERRLAAHESDIRDIEFSPDGRFLATASHDRTVKLWTVGQEGEPRILRGHQDFVLSLAFSPDSSRLVTGCEDGSCKVWDISGQEARELLTLYTSTGKVVDIAFSPDGQFLATAGIQGTVSLWPAMSWTAIQSSPGSGDTSAKRIENYKRAFWKKRMGEISPARM